MLALPESLRHINIYDHTVVVQVQRLAATW
jgi:hypothetical protein